ncbi:virulence factor SrfB [Zavarzinia sp.]|uniref:virulence factor SrfB n=1 Tax=Zavarzinia sp. TaxID=2027920 RepID=UPI00356628BD
MLKRLTTFRRLVSLVPSSGLQFLDFGFDIDALPKVTRAFWEEPVANTVTAEGQQQVVLRGLQFDETRGGLVDPRTGQLAPSDDVYELNGRKGLEPFLGRWVPLPYLKVKAKAGDGADIFDQGPSNWARLRVVELAERDRDGFSHRATLAFDTALGNRLPGRPYVMPSPTDATEQQEFALVAEDDKNAWFMEEAWVDQWLDENFREFKQAQRPNRPLRDEDFPHACEHWARYLTLLALIDAAEILPRVRLIDTLSEAGRHIPVEVDLVLDIGNSRTCGILMESHADDRMDLNDSYVLELRDLGHPEQAYGKPFESRVEFARASFGKEAASRRSGRANAFWWPSPVRIGPEAMRLAGDALGNEGATGLSSPKRYLWDTRALAQGWRFNGLGPDGVTTEPPVSGPIMGLMTEEGEVLRQLHDGRGQPAVRAKFSRSAIYSLMLAEILFQALAMINAPEIRLARRHGDVPRRLRRIVLTMPPAMPVAEQRIMRRRAEAAVKLVWDLMAQAAADGRLPPEPAVVLNLDEASGTQLVYLYTEITQKFRGDYGAFFALKGKIRDGEGYGAEAALRIASIDIGGGTTDLIVTTYTVEGQRAINPNQNFREGFKLAGDDILAAVIERHVLPAIGAGLAAAGIADPSALLKKLFSGNRGSETELERHLRRQFVAQVLEPAGLSLLHAYEQGGAGPQVGVETRRLDQVWDRGLPPSARVLAFFAREAGDYGATGFDLAAVPVEIDLAAIEATALGVIGQTLADLAEVIHAYDCDVLLLSGRPSRLPAVIKVMLAKLPVMPDRVVPMHQYAVGSWYPFRDVNARIEDPKTAAAVGAMLCGLAEGHLEAFLMRTSKLTMKSTARFFGEMEISGQIRRRNVFLSDPTLDKKTGEGGGETFVLDFYAPVFIGFRQLDLERWPATPLYFLEFAGTGGAAGLALPLKVTLERAEVDVDHLERWEEFRITEVEDAEGNPRRGQVALRLQTLKSAQGYWRDTGVLNVM